jgi:hypothetical protein
MATGAVDANGNPIPAAGTTGTVQANAVNLPTWLDQLNNQQGNQLSGALSYYNNPSQNWYQGPQVADFSTMQTNAQNQAATGFNQQPYQDATQGALAQYQTQFDPNQLSKFMDPYTDSAVKAMYAQSNRNLSENILPGVNSTFTGAGQFGSTRNADFENRAIRDTQTANDQTAAGMYNTQFNNAMGQYNTWNQNPLTAAAAWQNAGTTGQNNFWNQNQQQQTTGATQQALQQKGLDTAYQTWQQQYQSPLQAYAALQPSLTSLNTAYRPNTTTSTTGLPTTPTQAWGGALAGVLPTLFGNGTA